jgi:hypothetical protein
MLEGLDGLLCIGRIITGVACFNGAFPGGGVKEMTETAGLLNLDLTTTPSWLDDWRSWSSSGVDLTTTHCIAA